MPHRVAQEILELTEAQRLLLNMGVKDLDISRLLCNAVKHLPLVGVAEQVIAFMEVTGAEGLQRVFLSDGVEQVFVGIGQLPAAGQMITELADQH